MRYKYFPIKWGHDLNFLDAFILKKALSCSKRNKSMMTEDTKKLKKAKEQWDEFVRSWLVTRVKEEHGNIEAVEAQRKMPEALSLISRINIHLDIIYKFLDKFVNAFNQSFPDPSLTVGILDSAFSFANPFIDTYKSIREDFKKSMNLKDEDMEKLFGEREIHFENPSQLPKVLFAIYEQEKQMSAYLFRVIARA